MSIKAITDTRLFEIHETNLLYFGFMICSILLVSLLLLIGGNDAFAANIDLTATTLNEHTVSLHWTIPSQDYSGNKRIKSFKILYQESNDADFHTYVTGLDNNTRSIEVDELQKGTSYNFRVNADQVTGGMNSNLAHATTLEIDDASAVSPPKISGIGFYSISITDSEKPYAPSESYTQKPNTRFEDFFPYSKFSDQIDRGKYGSPINYGKSGQYFFTEGYVTSVPTLFSEINQPVQIQVRITDETDIFIGHLSLYTNVRGDGSDKQYSNLYVIFDRGRPIQVFDPSHYLKNVDVQASIENDKLWLIFDFVFQKPMKKSDILLESWNEGRIPVYAKIVDAWQISEPKQLETAEIPLNAEIEITHNAASPVCKADNSCFVPSETKILTGGTITWTNIDSFIHTITSGTQQYKDGKFGEYVYPTKSVKVTFDKPGTYPYFCELHPWATGKIYVSNANVISSTKEPVSQSTLIVKSITSTGSLLIENDDYVYLNEKSLTIEISGHVEGATHGTAVDFLLKRPDRSFEKFKIITNKEGYYKTVTVLDKKWQSGEPHPEF